MRKYLTEPPPPPPSKGRTNFSLWFQAYITVGKTGHQDCLLSVHGDMTIRQLVTLQWWAGIRAQTGTRNVDHFKTGPQWPAHL